MHTLRKFRRFWLLVQGQFGHQPVRRPPLKVVAQCYADGARTRYVQHATSLIVGTVVTVKQIADRGRKLYWHGGGAQVPSAFGKD